MVRCITMVVREGEREREAEGKETEMEAESGKREELQRRGGGEACQEEGRQERGIEEYGWGVRGRFFFWREKGELEMEAAFLGNRNERWTLISVASCPSIFSAPGAATGIFGMYR